MGRIILFISIVLVIEGLVIAIAINRMTVLNNIQAEYASSAEWLGKELANKLVDDARKTYSDLFEKTGAVDASMRIVNPRHKRATTTPGIEGLGKPLLPIAKELLETFWATMFHSILRLKMVLMWAPYLGPLLICAIIDGLNTREAKKHSYGYSSSNWYHMALYALLLLIIGLPAYLFIPLPMPTWTAPAWYIAATMGLTLLFSNLQKMY